jgi:serine/threonine protein kinase
MCALPTVRECGPGVTLGHYRILEKIGSGGMGQVFRAHDEHLDRDVALKLLLPGTLGDESARKRFRKEALALSKLNHPNIAIVHDFDTCDGIDLLVLEYIGGLSVDEKLSKGPLPENEVIVLGTQLAEALSAAHARGVIHRDLKPGNLRLADDGRLKILDFGLAQLSKPTSPTATTQSATETGGIAGTLAYMAPEQLAGGTIDGRTDIHAAGVVLYEMATGHHPFPHERTSELLGTILQSAPPPARTLRPGLSSEFDRIIGKCLEKDPTNRYQTAAELVVDLRRLARDSVRTLHVPANTRPTAVLRRSIIATGIVVCVVAFVLLASFVVRGRKSAPTLQTSLTVAASIAVLPFADLSPGHDHEYFGDGLAEEILNNLTKIPNLKVAARTSAFQFKGQNTDLREIGKKLNVANILEGSVQSNGNRVRITVHLTQANAGQSLWSENYDRDLKDIFVVEDEIAEAITSALQPKLLGRQALQSPPPLPTTTPEAYERSCGRARSMPPSTLNCSKKRRSTSTRLSFLIPVTLLPTPSAQL